MGQKLRLKKSISRSWKVRMSVTECKRGKEKYEKNIRDCTKRFHTRAFSGGFVHRNEKRLLHPFTIRYEVSNGAK